MGVPIKNDHVGVFWGYHHLRKHPYKCSRLLAAVTVRMLLWSTCSQWLGTNITIKDSRRLAVHRRKIEMLELALAITGQSLGPWHKLQMVSFEPIKSKSNLGFPKWYIVWQICWQWRATAFCKVWVSLVSLETSASSHVWRSTKKRG